MKPKILFFARDYQAKFFPRLKSDKYESIYVTYNLEEKKIMEEEGVKCDACFEELYKDIEFIDIANNYFITSFTSDRYLGVFSLKQRNEYLNKAVGFWKYIYEKYKPNFVLNEVIAIEFSEVMYIEAKKRGIRYLAWMISPFPDKQFYWLSNPFHASLDEEIFLKEPELSSQKYAEDFFIKVKNVPLFYVKNLKNRYNPIILLKVLERLFDSQVNAIFHPKVNELFYFDHSRFLTNQLKAYFASLVYKYDSMDSFKDFEFVFYPLHYEPEASLTYFAEFYDDQLNTIRNISKCLKNNQYLVVKEHPQQPGILLTKKFRELRKCTSNLIFLPAEYPTKDLIDKIVLIITISSTAGWEGLLANKAVVVMGKVFYDKHPDINHFKGYEELKMNNKNNNYKNACYGNNLKFLSQFYSYCQIGNPYPHSKLFEAHNIEFIKNAIEDKIK